MTVCCSGACLCRNVAFTYVDEANAAGDPPKDRGPVAPPGALVIGSSESLPAETSGLELWSARLGVYRKTVGS
jgi:hypothetical protein